jgi:hypothetical protein
MRHGRRPQDVTIRRCTAVAQDLALPVPFAMDEFRRCLERRRRRAVRLVPMVMEPGAPSGVWIGTADADYLCYEEQTSPFHQAHIVLHLTAQMVLGDGRGLAIDSRLVPDVSQQLIGLMLGGGEPDPVTGLEAETFAFRALEQGDRGPSALAAWRLLRQLRPLHAAALGVFPEVAHLTAPGVPPTARLRLHQMVIEIRDAGLALRPYRDPQVAEAAAAAAQAEGLTRDDVAAAAEAAVLASALRARTAGRPMPSKPWDTGAAPPIGPDLASEARWLARVSRALARLASRPRGDCPEENPLPGIALVAETDHLSMRYGGMR